MVPFSIVLHLRYLTFQTPPYKLNLGLLGNLTNSLDNALTGGDKEQGQGGLLGGLTGALGKTVNGAGSAVGQTLDGAGNAVGQTTRGVGNVAGGVTNTAGGLLGGLTGQQGQQQRSL